MSNTQSNSVFQFQCQCGATLKATAKMSGRKGKCKSCGAVLVIPAADEGESVSATSDDATGLQEMCSICQTAIEDDDDRTRCDACELPFHEECWTENLGCSAYGCENVDALKAGPDIRVGQGGAANPYSPSSALPGLRSSAPAVKAKLEPTEFPYDEVLLGVAALAVLFGFVMCGVPTLVVALLALWRIGENNQKKRSLALPICALVLCLLGGLIGGCLSWGYWF